MNRGIALVNTSTYTKNGKQKTAFKITGKYFGTTGQFLRNIKAHVDSIPESDRINLFYTIAEQGDPDANKRVFYQQRLIPFDLDGIDKDKIDAYLALFALTLNIDLGKIMVVCSGNGLHFLIAQKTPISDKAYFKKTKHVYNEVCSRLNRALKREELPGNFDTAIWEPSRILRMPYTTNRKEGKPDTEAYLIKDHIEPIDITIEEMSPSTIIKPGQYLPKSDIKRIMPQLDLKAMEDNVPFLQFCRDKPAEVNETQWYAMICTLIWGGEEGRHLIHEWSKGHPDYTPEDTEDKIIQAINNSPGPHTCEYIMSIWEGDCSCCPTKNGRQSPIFWKSEDFIETKDTGFHFLDAKGNPGKIDYEGLVKYFKQNHTFKVVNEQLYLYDGKKYELTDGSYLLRYAEDHFYECRGHKALEFKRKVLREPKYFIDNLPEVLDKNRSYVNLNNGILNVDTYEFIEHSPKFFFTNCLTYDYDPEAECPMYDKFIETVSCGDKEIIRLMDQIVGYAISNIPPSRYEKLFMFLGEGSNGKSRTNMIIEALIGKDAIANMSMAELQNSQNLALIENKKLCMNTEEEKAFVQASVIKKAASGENFVVKRLHQQPYKMAFTAKIIFMCNNMPQFNDQSKGLYRRFCIVPFNADFSTGGAQESQRDEKIADKIIAKELPGIFNRAIRGLKDLVNTNGFVAPKASDTAQLDFKKSNDSVMGFIDLLKIKRVTEPIERYFCMDIYKYYRAYCKMTGHKPTSDLEFGKRFRRNTNVMPSKAIKIDGKVKRGYKDIVIENKDDLSDLIVDSNYF